MATYGEKRERMGLGSLLLITKEIQEARATAQEARKIWRER